GPGELHPGREARNRYDDGLEAARVPSRFLAHHNELRTARLCFPAALPETHPFRPGGRGGGDHPVGGEDNSRPAGEEPPRNTCRSARVEYEQGRTTLSRTSGEPPGVNGSHGGVRGETDEIDGLEQ